jgi:hypothetical protein
MNARSDYIAAHRLQKDGEHIQAHDHRGKAHDDLVQDLGNPPVDFQRPFHHGASFDPYL